MCMNVPDAFDHLCIHIHMREQAAHQTNSADVERAHMVPVHSYVRVCVCVYLYGCVPVSRRYESFSQVRLYSDVCVCVRVCVCVCQEVGHAFLATPESTRIFQE